METQPNGSRGRLVSSYGRLFVERVGLWLVLALLVAIGGVILFQRSGLLLQDKNAALNVEVRAFLAKVFFKISANIV